MLHDRSSSGKLLRDAIINQNTTDFSDISSDDTDETLLKKKIKLEEESVDKQLEDIEIMFQKVSTREVGAQTDVTIEDVLNQHYSELFKVIKSYPVTTEHMSTILEFFYGSKNSFALQRIFNENDPKYGSILKLLELYGRRTKGVIMDIYNIVYSATELYRNQNVAAGPLCVVREEKWLWDAIARLADERSNSLSKVEETLQKTVFNNVHDLSRKDRNVQAIQGNTKKHLPINHTPIEVESYVTEQFFLPDISNIATTKTSHVCVPKSKPCVVHNRVENQQINNPCGQLQSSVSGGVRIRPLNEMTEKESMPRAQYKPAAMPPPQPLAITAPIAPARLPQMAAQISPSRPSAIPQTVQRKTQLQNYRQVKPAPRRTRQPSIKNAVVREFLEPHNETHTPTAGTRAMVPAAKSNMHQSQHFPHISPQIPMENPNLPSWGHNVHSSHNYDNNYYQHQYDQSIMNVPTANVHNDTRMNWSQQQYVWNQQQRPNYDQLQWDMMQAQHYEMTRRSDGRWI